MQHEQGRTVTETATSAEDLWKNLEYFLKEVVPVAEEAGVNLALHPDDPPMPMLHGKPQIIWNVEAMAKAAALVPSERNGLCFCQGTFASGGVSDMPAAIKSVGKHIKYVHFRDVVGEVPHFVEVRFQSLCIAVVS